MKYNYKNESLLTYLKTYESKDAQRMKMAREIILYFFSHPEYTLEQSTDIYLLEYLNKKEEFEKNLNKKKEVKNNLPTYLQSANLMFRGKTLISYLKEFCMNDFYDEKELYSCIRSIQHYLQKLNVSENEVEQKIEMYFHSHYQNFLKTYLINHLTYENVGIDIIMKYYVQKKMSQKYNKDFIYHEKQKLVRFIKQYYDSEKKLLKMSLNLLIELFILQEFQENIHKDVLFIMKNDTIKKIK